jgi:vacuolar-type H+-ATPase subunit I/STV1
MKTKTKQSNFLLPLNIQFFAENPDTDPSGATLNTTEQLPADSANDTSKQTSHMIPKSRFDEVNQKFKDVQAQLDQILAEKAATEKKAQEEQGKFQELYETTSKEFTQVKTQYESVESRAKELEGVINSLIETKLSTIPDDYHDLIPGNLTPEQKLDWINKAETKGLFGKRPQQAIGEASNPTHAQAFDLNTLSPVQLLKAGYGSK